MTSMTRLPTVAPVRPVSQPVITCAGEAPMMKPNGDPDDQEELNTFLVRQMYPVYWAMTNCPLASFGPLPWMRVLVTRVDGGLPAGMVTVGAALAWAVTVGSVPPPLVTWVPVAEAVSE